MKNSELNQSLVIHPVEEILEGVADLRRTAVIDFRCKISMDDSKPPFYFRQEANLSLEFIEFSDPALIGLQIKKMYANLAEAVNVRNQNKK